MKDTPAYNSAALAQSILESKDSSHVIKTSLETDERVIARVTDGIYRQPASAIRELISNSYDADATRVVIKTDAPRFDRISVEDNGHGMTPQALAHMLKHIGSSAKRSVEGKELGVTSSDPFKSPGGRRLIGKIGIGIFSVSQLTHTFQIITKVKGDAYRTIATVALRQYTDDEPQKAAKNFESGKVNIWREKAADIEAQGTTIVLTNIRPQAKDTLRSKEIWAAIEHNENTDEDKDTSIDPPKFHIGRIDKKGEVVSKSKSVPWKVNDSPEKAFYNLVQAVWNEVEQYNPNPKLERIFDYYLRMVWQLSLAVPLPYVDDHIFDIDPSNWLNTFLLSNKPKKSAEIIAFSRNETPRDAFDLIDGVDKQNFDVFFDNFKLQRPIKFRGTPQTSNALKKPIVFIGKCDEGFAKIPRELSGGPLKFEAYLFWSPKIAPTDHQGSLIRVHGASGTLFDSTFMRYQVAEQNRLRQITCEIFVREGFDSALNIDRESFNYAHPHAVYLTKWLHGALRQLASAQKRLASEIREENRGQSRDHAMNEIQKIAIDLWNDEILNPGSSPPSIDITDEALASKTVKSDYKFKRDEVVSSKNNTGARAKIRQAVLEEKLKAIFQVLASFNIVESLSVRQQKALLKAIYKILEAPEE